MHNLCEIGGNNTTAINYKEFSGNIIPNSWYKTITTASGKPDLSSIALLAEIVYWYRPGKDGSSKFKGNAWQTSYDHFEKKFGYNREAIRRIFVKLEQCKLVTREFRTVEYRGYKYNNVLFLHLNTETLFKGEDLNKKISSISCKINSPSPQICGEHIDEENKLEKKSRSNESNFEKEIFELEKTKDGLKADSENIAKIIKPHIKSFIGKKLLEFHPISESDSDILSAKSGREFNLNFINQLILKLSIKYPDYKFYNKLAFLNYMVKALANEMLQALQANNKDFRFAILPKTEEAEYNNNVNRLLEKIESSQDSSCDSILKKKLIARLDPAIAYELLTSTSITAVKNNFDKILKLKVKILKPLKLEDNIEGQIPDLAKSIILEEAKFIFGDELDSIEIEQNHFMHKSPPPKTILDIKSSNIDAAIPNIWNIVRGRLKKYYGDTIDSAWFSKISLKDIKQNIVTLKSPTSFIRDWIKTNYGLVIEREFRACESSIQAIEFI